MQSEVTDSQGTTVAAADEEALAHVKRSLADLRAMEQATPQHKPVPLPSDRPRLAASLTADTLILGQEDPDAAKPAQKAKKAPKPKAAKKAKPTPKAKRVRKADALPEKNVADDKKKPGGKQSGVEYDYSIGYVVKKLTKAKNAKEDYKNMAGDLLIDLTEGDEANQKIFRMLVDEAKSHPRAAEHEAKMKSQMEPGIVWGFMADEETSGDDLWDFLVWLVEDGEEPKKANAEETASPESSKASTPSSAPLTSPESSKASPSTSGAPSTASVHRSCTRESLGGLLNRAATEDFTPEVTLDLEDFEKHCPPSESKTPKKNGKEAKEDGSKTPEKNKKKKRDKNQHSRRMRFYRSLTSSFLSFLERFNFKSTVQICPKNKS